MRKDLLSDGELIELDELSMSAVSATTVPHAVVRRSKYWPALADHRGHASVASRATDARAAGAGMPFSVGIVAGDVEGSGTQRAKASARGSAMTRINTILVPTDFSDCARAATDEALALAERLGARVYLLHVYGMPAMPDVGGASLGVDILGSIELAAKHALAEECERVRLHPSFATASLAVGEPDDMIVGRARALPAELIIMGTHGRRGFKRLVLGSVAERVARSAPCPVLLCPVREHRRSHVQSVDENVVGHA